MASHCGYNPPGWESVCEWRRWNRGTSVLDLKWRGISDAHPTVSPGLSTRQLLSLAFPPTSRLCGILSPSTTSFYTSFIRTLIFSVAAFSKSSSQRNQHFDLVNEPVLCFHASRLRSAVGSLPEECCLLPH